MLLAACSNGKNAEPQGVDSVAVADSQAVDEKGKAFYYVQCRSSELAREGRWDEALAKVDSLLGVYADDQNLLIIKSMVYMAKGDKDSARPLQEKALSAIEREIAAGGTDHTLFYNRAAVECFLGKSGAYEKLEENKQYFENLGMGPDEEKIVEHFFDLIKNYDEETLLNELFLSDNHATGESERGKQMIEEAERLQQQ